MTKDQALATLRRILNLPIVWVGLYIVALVPIALAIAKGAIYDPDSAYYLLNVGKIAEGYIPYHTLPMGYTPLWFYLMYALSYPFGITCFASRYFLCIHFLFAIGNSVLITAIAKHFTKNKAMSLFAGWLLLVSSHWMDGNYVLLEIPSLFFGLLSLCLILYHRNKPLWHHLLYGIIAACSFLTKQFGFGFFLLAILLLLFEESRWRKIGFFTVGYAIPVALCFIIWGKALLPVIFSSHGTTSAIEAGLDISAGAVFGRWCAMMKYWLLKTPALIGILLFAWKPFKIHRDIKVWLLCLCAIIGFSLQFKFAWVSPANGKLHYFQYMQPFAVLLIAQFLTYREIKVLKGAQHFTLVLTVMLGLYATFCTAVQPTNDNPPKEIAAKDIHTSAIEDQRNL